MDRAVFIDRDGTVNEEMGYINHPSRLRIFPEAFEAVRLLNRHGILAILASNQAGLARGYFDERTLFKTHRRMLKEFSEHGAYFDLTLYSVYHPEAKIGRYRQDHPTIKPRRGLFDTAGKIFDIDTANSYTIGDRYRDILFGANTGLKTVFVLTGYGRGEYEAQRDGWKTQPDHIAENILEGVKWILKR